MAPHLRSLLEAEGGFTIDPATGDRVRCGIAVCVDPRPSASFFHRQWSDRWVTRWLAEAGAELARPGRYAGGWLDPSSGRVWLDVVTVVPRSRRRVALHHGRLAGQHNAFDLDRCELLPIPAARR
jgi:hypothetical protein